MMPTGAADRKPQTCMAMLPLLLFLGAAAPAADPAPAAPPSVPAPSAAPSPATAPEAAPAPLPSVTLPPELQRVLTDYETAWHARDAAALARVFAEDGFVLSWGGPPKRGRAAIERHYQGQGGPLALRALAWATEGSVGYIIGGYGHSLGAPDDGKFTLTLRREKGRWLIMSDMDSPNRRPR